jgi:hypothetical protein
MSVVGSVYFTSHGWMMIHEASALSVREPAMRKSTESEKAQIQTETDIEKLRELAGKYRDSRFDDWQEYCDRLRNTGGALLWASVCLATTSVVLGYSIYGLRIQKPMA